MFIRRDPITHIRCYSGDITPESGIVFVFGSNPEGRHGAGAAKIARERFGAIYGQGEGLQGNAYALPTKDLRVKENRGFRSISPEAITESIRKLYETARENPDRTFCIAYRNTDKASLNGYTGYEMMRMFAAAGPLPDNIVVSEEWADKEILKDEFKKGFNQNTLKMYDAHKAIAPGVNLAFYMKSDGVDWYEIVDNSGESLTNAAEYYADEKHLGYTSAHFENAVVNPDGSVSLEAVAHNWSIERGAEKSERKHPVTFSKSELMEKVQERITAKRKASTEEYLKNLLEERGGKLTLDNPVFIDYEFSDGYDGYTPGTELAMYAKEFFLKKDRIYAVAGKIFAEYDGYPKSYDENYIIRGDVLRKENLGKRIRIQLEEDKLAFQRKAKTAVASGKLKSVGELRDGWALVQAPNGKYNYADAEGKFMTKNWLDSASEFKDGKATVKRGGTVATINTEGICIAAKAEKTLRK